MPETRIELDKIKIFLIILFWIGLIAIGLWSGFPTNGQSIFGHDYVGEISSLLLVTISFLALIGYIKLLFTDQDGVMINRNGFVWYAFSEKLVPWNEVTSIQEKRLNGARLIAVDIKNVKSYLSAKSYKSFLRTRRDGNSVNLSTIALKISHNQLLALMKSTWAENRNNSMTV